MLSVSRQNQLRDLGAAALYKIGASRALLRKHEALPIVLLYHNPDPQLFAQHLEFLARSYAFVPARRASIADSGRPALAITFDDGYRGVHTHISPLLREAGAPATMFIPTAFLGKRFTYEALKLALRETPLRRLEFEGRSIGLDGRAARKDAWHLLVASLKLRSSQQRDEQVEALIEQLRVGPEQIAGADIVSREELRSMAEQLEIGSHTVTHPNLSRLNRAEAKRELLDSKLELEAITGRRCETFAYPIGRRDDYSPETVAVIAECGYAEAFTAVPTTDPQSRFEYPRIGVGDGDSVEILCLKLSRVWPKLFRLLV